MSLKNLKRSPWVHLGQPIWQLTLPDGAPIDAFRVFCARNLEYSPRTQKRYAEAVSRFLDYLFEARAFAQGPISRGFLQDVVSAYVLLLRDGSTATASRVRTHLHEVPSDRWLADAAEGLDWRRMQPASFANTLAAINRFLRLCEVLAVEAVEQARLTGVDQPSAGLPLFEGLASLATVSGAEVARLRQNSLLGGVAKLAGAGLRRPRVMRAPNAPKKQSHRPLDFPFKHLPALIQAATSKRDEALWLLLAASGIRLSEARNLLFEDVDFTRQLVFVHDPRARRYAAGSASFTQQRFKGRSLASTYLFAPLRQAFFSALEGYLRHEFVPCHEPGEPLHLFQVVEARRRGQALVGASDTALAKAFKKAVLKAQISGPVSGRQWTVHSLRHLYGVYMLNDFPVDPVHGRFGLELVEVQMLMGHASIRSTQHYARPKQERLEKKLQASDDAMLLTTDDAGLLPASIARRLEARP